MLAEKFSDFPSVTASVSQPLSRQTVRRPVATFVNHANIIKIYKLNWLQHVIRMNKKDAQNNADLEDL
jgi:hypothetical protein